MHVVINTYYFMFKRITAGLIAGASILSTCLPPGTRAQQRRQFSRANFGSGLLISKRAIQEAEAMLSLV